MLWQIDSTFWNIWSFINEKGELFWLEKNSFKNLKASHLFIIGSKDTWRKDRDTSLVFVISDILHHKRAPVQRKFSYLDCLLFTHALCPRFHKMNHILQKTQRLKKTWREKCILSLWRILNFHVKINISIIALTPWRFSTVCLSLFPCLEECPAPSF